MLYIIFLELDYYVDKQLTWLTRSSEISSRFVIYLFNRWSLLSRSGFYRRPKRLWFPVSLNVKLLSWNTHDLEQIKCFTLVNHSRRSSLLLRNQSNDLLGKSMDWLLYDMDICHEWVNENALFEQKAHKLVPWLMKTATYLSSNVC